MSDNEIKNQVSNNLKNGNPVIIHVLGEEKGGDSSFTKREHWMTIVDIDEENHRVYVSNRTREEVGQHRGIRWKLADCK